ncbi:MAG: hypothetical protein SFU98_12290 [Leptospiraceae bacterium]|nr:hypothetical protein [Leptospiraceae bacterium]
MEIVLGIEIDKQDEEGLRDILSGIKQKVIVVNFFDKVDEYVRSSRPDLIFLAIDPTSKPFLDYIRKLKQEPNTKDIPVIALLSKRDNNFQIIYKRLGFADYMLKPLSKDAVHLKIHEHLAHAKLNKPKMNHIEIERTPARSAVIFNAGLAKFVLPEIKNVLTPPVLKAIINTNLCIDIRNVPSIAPEEIIILERLLGIFGTNKKIGIIAGKHMGILYSASNLEDKANLFMSMEEFDDFSNKKLSN